MQGTRRGEGGLCGWPSGEHGIDDGSLLGQACGTPVWAFQTASGALFRWSKEQAIVFSDAGLLWRAAITLESTSKGDWEGVNVPQRLAWAEGVGARNL